MKSKPFNFKDELWAVLRLGGPMILTQLFIMLNGLIDSAMAGRYQSVDLAGVSLGGMMLWPFFMLLTGTTMAMTPIASQLRGANRTTQIGHQIRQALWICLFTSTILLIILLNVSPIYKAAGVDPAAADIAAGYLSAVAWGAPAIVFYVALRNVSEGLGRTVPPMIISGVVLPLNAFLNYALIYGKFGFPELGGVGCGYATAIIFWVQLAMMLFVIRQPYFKQTQLFARVEGPHPPTLFEILRVGLPIGFTVFLEMAVFSVVGMLIARIGVAEVAANSIAGNINWATYVIPMSLGAAASIRVGFHVGAGDYGAARATAATVYKFSIGYALVVSCLVIGLRYPLIGIFTTDPVVIEIAANLLIFIAIYQLVDDSQAVTIGALRGYKDTRMPMYAGLIGYWFIAVPIGYSLAEGLIAPGVAPGVYGYWTGLTVGLTLVAVAVGVRLWKTSADHDKISTLAHLES